MSTKIVNYEELLLYGIIPLDEDPKRVEAAIRCLDLLLRRVDPTLFTPTFRPIVDLAYQCRINQTALTEDIFVDFVQRSGGTAEQIVEAQMVFDRVRKGTISEGKFRMMIDSFMKEREEDLLKLRLGDAFTILTEGKKVGRHELRGVEAARSYLAQEMYSLDRLFLQDLPGGDVRLDAPQVWEEYVSRRDNPVQHRGCLTGMGSVDRITNGALPGELWLIAGFTSQGKSTMLINFAYNAVMQGKSVVIAVNEMLYKQYRIRFFIRHSCNPAFGLPDGIPYTNFKLGRMNPLEEKAFQQVIKDFETNPAYGRLEIVQIPKKASFESLSSRLSAIQSVFNIDAIFVDYLQLVGRPDRGQSKREYQDGLVADTKDLATSFNRGKGVCVISPWQTNRTSFNTALEKGYYGIDCLSEAPEAERSTDVVLWLLQRDEDKSRNELKAGIVKNRDGETTNDIVLFEDFGTGFLGDTRVNDGSSQVTDSGAGGLF